PEILLSSSRTRNGSVCYCEINSYPSSAHRQGEHCKWASEHGQCVRQLTVRQQSTKFSAGTLPMSAYGLNLPQDPLESKEEEVIEEYDSDSDSSLSFSHLS
ncbi:hypothetical protein ACROYT_G035481, partial [Oculina patagonica]